MSEHQHPAAMAEAERIRAIFTHEAAVEFRALAQMLAFDLALPPDQAAAILEAAKVDAVAHKATQAAGLVDDLKKEHDDEFEPAEDEAEDDDDD